MTNEVVVTEIFYNIQGESTHAGRPCAFVRLTGCPLRCTWCDTTYSFQGGQKMSFEAILDSLKKFPTRLVELTGGEPLSQANSHPLMERLIHEGFEVLLETSGAISVEKVPREVKIIMDLKAPGSGESHRNLYSNIELLKPGIDELKIVVANRKDFDFALQVTEEFKLLEKFTVLISPSYYEMPLKDLASWICESGKDFKFQVQLHKFIWGAETKGV